jgi:hypothetical protein
MSTLISMPRLRPYSILAVGVGLLLSGLLLLTSSGSALLAFWHERELTRGTLKGLRIGATTRETLRSLQQLGVRTVFVDSTAYPVVSRSADIEHLRLAETILLPGIARIDFRGDDVADLRLIPAPIIRGAGELLEPAKSRDQVFSALRRILEENPGTTARAAVPGPRQVPIDMLGSAEMAVLANRDIWQAGFRDWQGWWAVKLHFENGNLRRITYTYSPIEFF